MTIRRSPGVQCPEDGECSTCLLVPPTSILFSNKRRSDIAVIENSVEIARSPEDVFDYLVDLRNELEWNPDAQSMEKITDGPIGLGTKFLAKWKQSKLVEVECVEFDRPRSWSYHNRGPLEVVFQVTLSPTPAGSLLSVRFDARPKGALRVFFPVTQLVLKRVEKNNMSYIKRALERSTEADPSRLPDS